MTQKITKTAIPIIEVHSLFAANTDEQQKAEVGAALVSAAEEVGFLMVRGVPISTMQSAQAFSIAKKFFAQPIEQKQQIAIEKSACHRGYFGFGGENLDPAEQRHGGDAKEGIKIGQDLPKSHPWVLEGLPLHGSNQWPDDEIFRETMWQLYQDLQSACGVLLGGIALGLGLERDYFARYFQTPMATLAPLHYPPIETLAQRDSLGAGAHTDFGCLTLVLQDGVSGLQVQRRDGAWLDVPIVEGAMVMNIGDMLQRWSNDRLRSTRHRVLPSVARSRYSMAFFYDPEPLAPLTCLPTCQSATKPCAYSEISALDYLLERIAETFDYYS